MEKARKPSQNGKLNKTSSQVSSKDSTNRYLRSTKKSNASQVQPKRTHSPKFTVRSNRTGRRSNAASMKTALTHLSNGSVTRETRMNKIDELLLANNLLEEQLVLDEIKKNEDDLTEKKPKVHQFKWARNAFSQQQMPSTYPSLTAESALPWLYFAILFYAALTCLTWTSNDTVEYEK